VWQGLNFCNQAIERFDPEIFGEYLKLVCGVSIEPHGKEQKFMLKTTDGFRIDGVVNKNGEIVVGEKERAAFICPK
jgi:hypothetical protein